MVVGFGHPEQTKKGYVYKINKILTICGCTVDLYLILSFQRPALLYTCNNHIYSGLQDNWKITILPYKP